MTGFTQAEADAVLTRALELSGTARETYLDDSCGRKTPLRALVERLLETSESDELLLRPGGGAQGPLWEDLARQYGGTFLLEPGARLGAWKIVRTLGRGGMASVYLAERADGPFEQTAALKLLDVTRDFDSLALRFAQERQILATLSHPNIARLIDGGATPAGQPYVVMEYIDGEPIDLYCDRHRLTVEERIELFAHVIEAVQYAHGRLIVHRDIKPSNILVSADGRPKLLDFGIAKLLGPPSIHSMPHTQSAVHPMTPEYASPEQVRAEPLTTASDVYQLGYLLYGLLTGCAPYRLDRRNVAEIVQVVCGTEAVRPSAALAVREQTEEATRISAARSVTPEALRRTLQGDLDNILLTALRKEPEQRYLSASHLGEDLRRHLEGRPVAAHAPTLRYRAGKFVRRNRVAAGAAALLTLTLAAGVIATAWQARVASQEARRAAEVRDFIVGLFESVDPNETLGETVTVKELLDRGAAQLGERLADEPMLRAEMLGVIGRMYTQLGFYAQARPLLERARAELAAGDGRENEIAQTAEDLATVLREQGELEAAEKLAREAVALRRVQAEPAQLAESLVELASILGALARTEESNALFEEALLIDRGADDKEALAAHLNKLSDALFSSTQFDASQRAAEEALSLQRELHGKEHTLIAAAQLTLGNVLSERGDFEGAQRLFTQALAMRRKLLGEAHPHVAIVFNEIGSLRQRMGELDAAEAAHRNALAIQRRVFREDHPELVNTINHLGVVYYYQGKSDQAVDAFANALSVWRQSYGPHHPDVYSALNNLGAAQRQAGDYDAAERTLREALALRREEFGSTHKRVAQSLNNLAILLVAKQDHEEAEMLFREAIAMWRSTLDAGHPDLADGLVSLGKLLLESGRYEEAEVLLQEAVRIRVRALAPRSSLLASARLYLGEALIALERAAEATPPIEASLPVLIERWGEDEPIVERARSALLKAKRAASAATEGA